MSLLADVLVAGVRSHHVLEGLFGQHQLATVFAAQQFVTDNRFHRQTAGQHLGVDFTVNTDVGRYVIAGHWVQRRGHGRLGHTADLGRCDLADVSREDLTISVVLAEVGRDTLFRHFDVLENDQQRQSSRRRDALDVQQAFERSSDFAQDLAVVSHQQFVDQLVELAVVGDTHQLTHFVRRELAEERVAFYRLWQDLSVVAQQTFGRVGFERVRQNVVRRTRLSFSRYVFFEQTHDATDVRHGGVTSQVQSATHGFGSHGDHGTQNASVLFATGQVDHLVSSSRQSVSGAVGQFQRSLTAEHAQRSIRHGCEHQTLAGSFQSQVNRCLCGLRVKHCPSP
ncbi:hypothetical protein D3C86_1199210 [compost metagenome]